MLNHNLPNIDVDEHGGQEGDQPDDRIQFTQTPEPVEKGKVVSLPIKFVLIELIS